ncbi:hypothetical protein HPG69_017172 [Diceros bicornis minor]|uniref:Uncharacterized protein n=1 Tax=Diceros bicornis minor TaxID=77932 RepID=A0A7J7ECN7_DICBM|nr:hypothetical protein HPG69_017172 [Diceros bicornis minor]
MLDSEFLSHKTQSRRNFTHHVSFQVPENMSIEGGRFCRVDFNVSGLLAPDVSYYINGRPVQSDDVQKMIIGRSFRCRGLCLCCHEQSRRSQLYCAARHPCKKNEALMFIYKPQSKKVFEEDSVKLECQISAVPPPKLFRRISDEMVQFNTDRISS